MGLYINVYRTKGYDCTDGPSATANGLCLVNVDGPFEPCEKYPAAMLVPGALGSARIIPGDDPKATGFMNGGNYGATSDSRFSAAVGAILGTRFYGAIAIHDRREW